MNSPIASSNRRQFLKAGLLASTALLSSGLPLSLRAGPVKTQRDPFHGLKIGMTSYTLRKYDLDHAIAITRQAGVKYISLKDVHLPMRSSREQRQETHKKIEAAGLVLLGGGVIYMKNDESEIQRAFEYVKDAGMPTMICSPDPEGLDIVERLAKQYDIRIAIHNHGPGDKKYPSPLDVLRMVKNRDSRMGICMDVGHSVRIGEDPVKVLKQCAARLYDFHMKDVTAATPEGQPTELGKGIIDIVGVLKALVQMKYAYHVALEYEAKENDPVSGVLECYAYMRGVLATVA
jgi:sugar phosphate isomerase/epimerase